MVVGELERADVQLRDGADEAQAQSHAGRPAARVAAVEALWTLRPRWQREAQKAAMQAQKQVEERRRLQQDHARAAKKAEIAERRKRREEKRD